MGKCKIKIFLLKKVVVELDSDNPDIRKLIERIVVNKDKIVADEVKIECKESNFDSKGFKKIVVELITKTLKEIKINEKELEEALSRKNNVD